MKNSKNIFLSVVCLISTLFSYSQNYKLPTPNHGGLTDMVVYDREGNTYHLDDLRFPMPPSGGGPMLLTIPPTCNAGIFRLHFADSGTGLGFDDPVDGPARQAIACQVYTELSQLLNEANSPYTSIPNLGSGTSWVEIEVQSSLNSSTNPTLGTAGQFFLSTTPGIVHGSVWQTINSGIDSWFGVNASNLGAMGIYHGQMQINFGHPFYLGSNPTLIPPGEFDLYTVILHEAMHALGIGSLINQAGNSKITGTNPGIFSIYDTFLEDNATGNPFIIWNGCYVASTNIPNLANLVTPCTSTFSGTSTTFVSTDPPWSNGTSLSHYPTGSCGNLGAYVMNPSLAPGTTKRFPDIEEVTTLCDIGYSTSGIYAATTYPAIGVCGLRVAGVNDFATYTPLAPGTTYQTAFNTPFPFSSTDILGNDENAGFYDCLEVANASGTLAGPLSGGTGSTITFTPNPGYSGVAILRYIPRLNSTGRRGNITYIFILVMPPALPPCSPGLCEMVCYGGFEEFTSQLQYDLHTLGSFSTGNSFSYNPATFPDNSPDLRTSGYTAPTHFSCGLAGGAINANTGTQFIGMILRNDPFTFNNNPEGPAIPLNGTILPGETVTVTLWARLAHSSCMGGVEVRFTNMPPCIGPTYPLLSSCAGLVQSVPIASGALVNNSLWQQFTFVYTNVTGTTLTHLLINSLPYAVYSTSPYGFIYLDDVSCIKNTPNITVTKTGPTEACPNDIVPYTITVCNTSTFPALTVQITDVLSAGLTLSAGGTFTYPTTTIPVLAPGACQVFTLNALVTATLGNVTNTANVSSGGCLVNATTNTVTTTITQPTLNITQTVSSTSPVAGSTINLTVDICNYTSGAVTGINVQTTLPAGYTAAPGSGYTVSAGLITFTTFNLSGGTTTSPACSTFVIPVTVPCSGSGNICTTILSGGTICTTQNNCNTINVVPVIVTVTPPSATILSGGSVTLTASGASTYTWSPSGSLSCSSCPNPLASPTVTTTYTVTGTNAFGCTGTTTVVITVSGPCGTCPQTLDALAPGGNLATNPPGGQNYCLLNNITITAPVNIVLCEVSIAPGVTITVNPGASLTLTGSHLYACTDMWQGIVVKPGGTVKTQNFAIPFPPISRSTMIEDAFVAIDILGGSTVTTNLLSVTNTTFNRNQVGIRIDNYMPALASYPFTIESSVFTCRAIAFTPGAFNWPHTNAVKATYAVFNPLQTPYINDVTYPDNTPGAFLKPPFLPGASKPNAGIMLNKVGQTINAATSPTYYEIKIGTVAAPKNNVFDNLAIGIDALNSNFTCVNNVFQRTIGGQKGNTAINAVAQEIFNCRLQAIPAVATNFVNKFYDCGKSIVASNYFEVNARYCELYSLQNFTFDYLSAFHRGQNGFIINTNRYISIDLSNNIFSNIEFGVSFATNNSFYSVGPWTSGSGQYSGQVNINLNTFQPFVPGSPLANTYVDRAIVANNITGTTHYISPTQNVSTNNNQVNNVYKGIRCNNWQKKTVITNTNTITLLPIPGLPTAVQYGISHANNIPTPSPSNNVIQNNVTGYGIANANLVGIATQLCKDQIVNCNTTSNVTMGIYFAGDETPTVFKYNTFNNAGANRHKYAYVLDMNGVIGQQGAPGSPSDNRWTPSTNWTPGVHFKTATMNGSVAWNGITGSPLWVRASIPAGYNPSGVGFNTSLFPTLFANEYNVPGAINTTVPPTLTPFPCPLIHHIAASPMLILSMEKVAKDEVPYTVNSNATKIIGKNQLYRLLKNDPSYMSASVDLQNFYLQSQTMYREQFLGIEEDVVTSDFASAQSKIAALVLESNIEINYKDFYNIYIKQQTDSLVSEDSTLLYTIANGCPFTDGAIVYQARAMYNSVFDVNKDFEDHCVNVEDRNAMIAQPVVHTFDADLFPNPTTGEVFINPKGLMSETMEIVVKDVNGKTVYSQNLQLADGLSNFKLDISNGVYFIHITNTQNHETIVKKLVIQK